MADHPDSFGTLSTMETPGGSVNYFSLAKMAANGFSGIERLPFSIRILLENLLRNEDGTLIKAADAESMANWSPQAAVKREVPFMPARVLLQDFTGVPAVVDLAAMRDAAQALYGDPLKVNPRIPAELIIDHSVQVDYFGSHEALKLNEDLDYQRNGERYAFLRWGMQSINNFSVVPPAAGICHQVNLENLGRVVFLQEGGTQPTAFPDTLLGLDSHTTMINGLGIMGWGVGGIEAEAVMLGTPYYLLTPEVIGFRLSGQLQENITATDLVLTVTQMLREKGVVGKFVEFFGPGLATLPLEDRATIANMSPEYGATMGFFPVDDRTLDYLKLSGRPPEKVTLVETYCKAQGLFRTDDQPEPLFNDTLELDMKTVEASLAGPKRPQDRIALTRMKPEFQKALSESGKEPGKEAPIEINGQTANLKHGSVVIAAITSCTNTSNPFVLIGAALMAKKAVEKGLAVKPWVKTSMAAGSRVVIRYLESSGLLKYLEDLKFHNIAYGCTTCIGNSGPLPEPVDTAIREQDLVVASVLSGNRNFEGRINPLTLVNYLGSPLLVVAYALAGRVDIDFVTEPIGSDSGGKPLFLADIWPDKAEIKRLVAAHVKTDMYLEEYGRIYDGSDNWNALPVTKSTRFAWVPESTYIKEPPFFKDISLDVPEPVDIEDARVLAFLGDSVTTDHISPAGAIPLDSPAADYLRSKGVKAADFNSYGSRRGNHEVMMRGTFGNIRLDNLLVPGVSGDVTRLMPENETTSIFAAAMTYIERGTPLVVVAGKEYGTGSSRDWAAKGTSLLGVKAVIAESFERIHRSNLVCMGVLPLEFAPGTGRESVGLDGSEFYTISGTAGLQPGKEFEVVARREDGSEIPFKVITRIDTPAELQYYRHGGVLHYVLRNMH
jgi:aconitate hydratase